MLPALFIMSMEVPNRCLLRFTLVSSKLVYLNLFLHLLFSYLEHPMHLLPLVLSDYSLRLLFGFSQGLSFLASFAMLFELFLQESASCDHYHQVLPSTSMRLTR